MKIALVSILAGVLLAQTPPPIVLTPGSHEVVCTGSASQPPTPIPPHLPFPPAMVSNVTSSGMEVIFEPGPGELRCTVSTPWFPAVEVTCILQPNGYWYMYASDYTGSAPPQGINVHGSYGPFTVTGQEYAPNSFTLLAQQKTLNEVEWRLQANDVVQSGKFTCSTCSSTTQQRNLKHRPVASQPSGRKK